MLCFLIIYYNIIYLENQEKNIIKILALRRIQLSIIACLRDDGRGASFSQVFGAPASRRNAAVWKYIRPVRKFSINIICCVTGWKKS
jgi:hypothetical protein